MVAEELMAEVTIWMAIVLGLLGAVVRIVVQGARGSGYPNTVQHLATEAFLGAVAGFLIHLAGFTITLEIFAGGYMAVDVIEGVVGRFKPKITEGHQPPKPTKK